MKKILIITISCFILNGCCVMTSQDCGCEPSSKEFLIDEPKEWLMSFENGEFQIFQDDNGNLDSFAIERVQDTGRIGGDECGADSEIERANLLSINRYGMRFSIEAMERNHISTNYVESQEDFIQITMNAQTEEFYIFNKNTTAEILNNFDWNGESISVLKVNCTGSSNCFNYAMRQYIISKELGLLEFVDNNANTWKRIN
ncbi:MAG TPA: hypothetical protein ENJ53_09480 [Phaeodactylibacter sp.]|nr:hypothetical protein [Phaeodactylibacter sp.]